MVMDSAIAKIIENEGVYLNQQNPEKLFDPGQTASNLTTNTQGRIAPFQRWYKFKEAFAPSLVFEQIRACPELPSLIVDPFGGSGTTAMIASSLSIPCSTIEVNPFLADLIEAKIESYDPHSILLGLEEVIAFANLDKGEAIAQFATTLPVTFIEESDKSRWIFNLDVASRVLALRLAIERLRNGSVARLLRVLLGSCLIEVSNVIISGKGRRYRQNWQEREISPEYVDCIFQAAVSSAVEDVSKFHFINRSKPTVFRGDAREKVRSLPSSIDLALFSPPYPNSFDYTDIYNVELWVLGYLNAPSENRSLREATLRSHVQIKRDFGDAPAGSSRLADVLDKLEKARSTLWSPWIPEMVGAYFNDLTKIIREISEKLSPSGRIVMVVGDSRYADIHIPVGEIISDLAKVNGLKQLSMQSARSMRSSPQQGGSHVLSETLITLSL